MFDQDILIADLRFEIKVLKDKLEAFESGEKYIQMEKEFLRCRNADARTIRRLKNELADARKEMIHVRNLWFATCDDLEKKIEKLNKKEREWYDKYIKKTQELYASKTELEEEKEKNKSLQSRLKKDHTNSSKSSSMNPNHETIHKHNSREKSGKKPGAQPGHKHHGRKKHEPTDKIQIPPPDVYLDTDRYLPTGKTITRQLVKVHVITEVIEYSTPEYRDKKTRQRVHAPFPDGVIDDVNYDGTVKAMAYMINNDLYTSIDKTRLFMKDITHGEIDISNGFICKLSKEFSEKTAEERNEIFDDLLSAPVLHADFTFGRANGKQMAVIITCADGKVLYQGREKKGDEGVKDSPLEFYDGTLISDHEAALIKHGSQHQECLAHLLRYAKAGMENEPDKTWHKKLAEWIGRAIGYWDSVVNGWMRVDKGKARELINELHEILELARDEYEYEPPSKYFTEGHNTFKRMEESFDDYVLFLREISVEPTNNEAERYGRKFKRKAHQVMSFRSQDGGNYFCDGLSITESVKAKGENEFDALTQRFNMT